MKKLLDAPEVVAAIFTVIGTLLVSIILGFLEGRIGFGPLVFLFVIIVLGLLLYALYRRAGTKVTAGASVAMVVIGFLVFFRLTILQCRFYFIVNHFSQQLIYRYLESFPKHFKYPLSCFSRIYQLYKIPQKIIFWTFKIIFK